MGIGRRSLEIVRAEGPRALWWRGLGVTVYRRLALFVRRLEVSSRASAARITVAAELLEPRTIDEYVALRPDTPVEETERRLTSGQRCVLVRHEGGLVGARWFATERAEISYLELVYELPVGVVYVYDSYTAPSARGLGITAVVRSFNEELLMDEGHHTLLAAVLPENESGRALVAAGGYEPVGRIGCLRLGPVRVPIRRGPVPYLGDARSLALESPARL